MNLYQTRMVVAVLVVALFVVAAVVVGATRTQPPTTKRDGPSTSDLLPGLAVAGVAAIAILATDRREAARLEHEREMRLRDERIRVYSAFQASWEAYEAARNKLYIGPDRTEVDEAHLQLLNSFNALSLLAPEYVREAAHHLMEWSNSDPPDRDPSTPGRFWKAARKDLGIPD